MMSLKDIFKIYEQRLKSNNQEFLEEFFIKYCLRLDVMNYFDYNEEQITNVFD